MNRIQITHISSMDEVKEFFRYIVYDLHINFHPDDDFKDYGLKQFSNEDIICLNNLMDESFSVCKASGEDIYAIGLDILLGTTGYKVA